MTKNHRRKIKPKIKKNNQIRRKKVLKKVKKIKKLRKNK